jgi:nicotinate dehydrogenase subunit B
MSEAAPPARRLARAALVALGLAILLFALFVAWAYRPSIAAIPPPAPNQFPAALVERGASLVKIGNCASCHTAPQGPAFAGGVPLATNFGTIYGSNITPDAATGIGGWSEQAFARALREGIARDGSHLYPAFPYDHFTKMTDADIAALYAYLMTRPPVRLATPGNRLILPLRFRPFVAGWKLLYFHPQRYRGSDVGGYFAEALAHCGACHTPHNRLGAELRSQAYAGGWVDGWYAPPLNRDSPAVRAWTVDQLMALLRTGLSSTHAAAAGPMGEVSHNLATAPEPAVRAIATYFARSMADARAGRTETPLSDNAAVAAHEHPFGAALFESACSSCHEPGARMMVEGRPALPLGSPLHENNPRNTIQIILRGLNPPVGSAGPYMPPFGASFTDHQVAEIVNYLHARYGTGPVWPNVTADVKRARQGRNP